MSSQPGSELPVLVCVLPIRMTLWCGLWPFFLQSGHLKYGTAFRKTTVSTAVSIIVQIKKSCSSLSYNGYKRNQSKLYQQSEIIDQKCSEKRACAFTHYRYLANLYIQRNELLFFQTLSLVSRSVQNQNFSQSQANYLQSLNVVYFFSSKKKKNHILLSSLVISILNT